MNNLSDADFKDYYENKHAPLASSLLTLEGYERNYVNSELNPLYASLGSISIFQYQSIQSLEIVGNEMSSSAGDILREVHIPGTHSLCHNDKILLPGRQCLEPGTHPNFV